jgi:hypothetical protein
MRVDDEDATAESPQIDGGGETGRSPADDDAVEVCPCSDGVRSV